MHLGTNFIALPSSKIIAYQKNLLNKFLWLPAKLSLKKCYVFWLVARFILLSKNICFEIFAKP